jgi:hypothetical protein
MSTQNDDLTLDKLLATLTLGLQKSAGDEKDEEDEKDEKKDKDEKSEDKDKKSECKEDKDEKGEKDEDKKSDEKKEGNPFAKSASEIGTDMAREIMAKVASNLETPMNKQAQSAGQALASTLLENLQKKANAGDLTVMTGESAAGTVPNKTQIDATAQVAEGAASIKPMLTGDGVRNQGTINEIFDAMVQDALAQGAAGEEQVHSVGLAQAEGGAESGVPNQVKTASAEDELEKAAAISTLVENGVDFDDAVELVKQAAYEIEFEMEKSAAMNQLITEGVSFEDAVEMVKEASAGDLTVMTGESAEGTVPNKTQMDATAQVAEGAASIKPMLTGDGVRNGGTVNQIFDAIVQDAVAQGATGEEQVHETGISQAEGNAESGVPNQVKVAAIERMVDAGVDFDEAVEFVKQASIASMATRAGRKAQVMAGRAGQTVSRVAGDAKAKAGPMLDAAKAKATSMMGAAKAEGAEAVRMGKLAVDPKSNKFSSDPALTRRTALQSLAGNRAVQGGAAALAVGAGGTALAMRNREKQAALEIFVEAGIDFDEASKFIKEASWADVKAKAKDYAGTARLEGSRAIGRDAQVGGSKMQAAKKLIKNPLVAGGAAAALAVGGAAVAMRNREKKAAFDALVEAGVDFEDAASLVTQKAQELYGE